MEIESTPLSPEIQVLIRNKDSGYKYKERREEDWRENYTLYRDKVIVNRLTQRQSVNIPLMKKIVRTLLKDIDDMPVIHFQNLDNDAQKEVFLNEYWKWTMEKNKMEIQDVMDKKQCMLFGRTFDQMQIMDGAIKIGLVDVEDILIDRYVDPYDIDSARYLIHTHIFVPISDLEKNENYDQEEVQRLKDWYASEEGLVKAEDNYNTLQEKNQKMKDIGDDDVDDPILGETYVELSLHFLYDTQDESEEEELFLKVEAENRNLLMSMPLEEVIGETEDNYWRNHFPYNTWAEDIEKQDFWSDGVADIIRGANKVLNAFYSQLVENRTLRNLGMQFYNSNLEGFQPQSFVPRAFGWYGIPIPDGGDIRSAMQRVDIPDLSEAIDEMNYIEGVAEGASGATATLQGETEQKTITLGEVQLALGEAKDRVKGLSKFYTHAWKMRGEKFLKLIEAAPDKLDAVKIYRDGRNSTDVYEREIGPNDWMSKSGYRTRIWSQDEKNTQDTKAIEKLNVAMQIIPNNPKLTEEYQRKILEFADLPPEKVNEIIEAEKQRQLAFQDGLTPDGQPIPQQGMPVQGQPIQ